MDNVTSLALIAIIMFGGGLLLGANVDEMWEDDHIDGYSDVSIHGNAIVDYTQQYKGFASAYVHHELMAHWNGSEYIPDYYYYIDCSGNKQIVMDYVPTSDVLYVVEPCMECIESGRLYSDYEYHNLSM